MPKTTSETMVFLGIDPGTTRTGFGVIAYSNGRFSPLTWGTLLNENRPDNLLVASIARLRELTSEWQPVSAGVERLFFSQNKTTGMAVGEMRGAILICLADLSIPVFQFTPQQVKLCVSGHGGAHKQQVQAMVCNILKIKGRIEPDDAADALALAICAALAHTKGT